MRESSQTQAMTRSGVSAGGGPTSVSSSYRLVLTVGEEVADSTTTSATRRTYPGLGHVLAYPGSVSDLSVRPDVSLTSMTLTWSTPGYDGAVGALMAGTTYFIRVASYTVPDTFTREQAQITISTKGVSPGAGVGAGVTGLLPNTTWYSGLWTADRTGNVSSGSVRGAGSTLADPPIFIASPFLNVYSASVTVRWAALPTAPSSKTCEGYVLEASSTNFGALSPGGVVSSSATAAVKASTLTVSEPPLISDKLYYFRVASLNWEGRTNSITLGSAKTVFEAQIPDPDVPAYTDISTGSIVAHWLRSGNPLYTLYQLDISKTAGFAAYSSSTTFNLFAATTTLSANTTYYFRVDATTDTSSSAYGDLGSTMTLAYTPTAAGAAFTGVRFNSVSVSWLTGGNPINTSSYSVVLSTDSFYPNADAGNLSLTTSPVGALPTATLTALSNTTYYAFVASLNSIGALSPFISVGSTFTPAALPVAADPAFSDIGQNSFTAIWNANGNPLSVTTFTVEASTSPTFDAGTQFSVMFDTVPATAAASFTGLEPDTTYYFRANAHDFLGRQTVFVTLGSTSTLPAPPSLLNFDTVEPTPTSIRLDWSGGANGPGTAYRANVSTSAVFGGGAVVTTHTIYATNFSTSGLSVNTTYYLRLAAVGNDASLSDLVYASTPTRANIPTAAAATFASVGQSSFTVLWNRNGNPVSVTTYTVHVSSAIDFNTGVYDELVFTTAPAGANPSALVTGLNPGTSYYFRVDALSRAGGASAYAVLGATSTHALAPVSPSASLATASSMTVTWTPVTAAGYEIRASSTNFGALLSGGSVAFSSVTGGGVSSLGVYGLVANTTYYFRVAAYDWGRNTTVNPDAAPYATLAVPVSRSMVYRVFATSATANWTPLPAAPQSATAEGYMLEAATAASAALPSDFTGVVFSSISWGIQPATLTVSGLYPGTTYTLRVSALNWAGEPNYATAGTAITGISNFVWNAGSGLWNTATNWLPNGVPNAGSQVTIDANATVTASGNAINFLNLTLGDPAGTFAPTLLISTGINSALNMTVYKNATFTQGVNQEIAFAGDVSFLQGSALTHTLIGTTPQNATLDLSVAGTFTLQAGATAAVSALGFNGGAANGGSGIILAGGGGVGNSASSAGGSGGGHGGAGGQAGVNAGGVAYDSYSQPAQPGSGGGGGDSTSGGVGGRGGGVAIIHAGSMNFDGLIAADGAVGGGVGTAGTNIGAGGGGSGGGVAIFADYFVGAGTITVLGGNGGADVDGLDDPGGGGGGGRAAVSVGVSGSVCDLTVSVAGGASGGGTSSAGAAGTYSSTSSLQSPANFAGVVPTSTTILWTWDLAQYGQEYQVMASTGGPISPLLGASAVSYLETSLLANTTYSRYVRVSGCNSGANSAGALRSTLAAPPSALAQSFTDIQTDNITAAWQAMPASPQGQSSEGYRLEASTTNFGALTPGGDVVSSATFMIAQSTLAVFYPPLSPNTTYYLRVAAYNWVQELSSYTALGAASTLSVPPARLAEDFLKVYSASVTVQWAALPYTPQGQTAEGFIVEASSTNFGNLLPGGVVSSSATTNVQVSTLTVHNPALITNQVYYFRVGSLNWNGVANYTMLGSTLTPLEMQVPLPDDPTYTDISSGSIVAHWLRNGNPASSRYTLEVSADPGFAAYSSTNVFALSEGTGTLAVDTLYYFRARASSSSSVSAYADLGSTRTHAYTPAAAGTAYPDVQAHQLTVSWLSGGNPLNTTIYSVVASTESLFPNEDAANIYLSTTPAGSLPTGTLGVTPNTTYYVFVSALNSAGALSQALAAGEVLTPAAAPKSVVSTFSAVTSYGFTASWNADGNPLSVTTYTVEASSSPAFDAGTLDSVVFDTVPASPSVTFDTLGGNTTYYFRVQARDHQSRATANIPLGSTTTHAGSPSAVVSAVNTSSLTVSWTPVPAAGYELKASSTNFIAGNKVAFSSVTGGSNSSLVADGLALNTTYYLRLTAYNWGGHPSLVELNSHSTLAQAVAGAVVYQVFATSATANWTPRPGTPQAATAEGYILEASTAASLATLSDFGGVIFSSISYGVQPATLTVTGLDAGATYTLRVGVLNWSDDKNYANAGGAITTVSDYVWNAGSGLWNTATNWLPNGVPSAGSRVTIDANATVTASGNAINFFTLTLGDPAGTFAPVLVLSTPIARARDMIVHKNAAFTQGVIDPSPFSGDVTFEKGSLINHTANTTSPQTAQVRFQVDGTFTLQAGATAALSGLGFNGGAANGGIGIIIGGGGGNGSSASNSGGSGAGHGGAGGTAGPNQAGLTYDSLTSPVLAGSGGGGGDTSGAGGKGAGVLIVSADTLIFDGLVTADGASGAAGTGGNANAGAGGGGSGGSVNLSANYFVGAGTISVAGGAGGADADNGDDPGGGGGGGRVAVAAAVSGGVCDLTVTLTGGSSGGGTSGSGAGGTFSGSSSLQAPTGFASVAPTSTTILWTWNLAASGKNYQVMATTGGPVSPLLGPTAVSYLESPLLANTTYTRYVRVSACSATADSASASRATLTAPPTALPRSFPTIQTQRISAAWAAYPTSPQAQSAEGYVMEASSTNFTLGDYVFTSQTSDIALSTLATPGYPTLEPNTTYFFRVAALNWAGALSSYTALGSTSTLAPAPTLLAFDYTAIYETSATLHWAAMPSSPPDASSKTAEGYVLEASTTNFGAVSPGGVTLSSVTRNLQATALTIVGLDQSTTIYFRVGSLNHNDMPDYTDMLRLNMQISPSIVSLDLGTMDPQVSMSTVAVSSYVITNVGTIPLTFTLSASTITVGSAWVLGTVPAYEVPVLQGLWNTARPSDISFVTPLTDTPRTSGGFGGDYAGDQTGTTVYPGQSRTLWFRFTLPTGSADINPQTLRVKLQHAYP